MHQLVQPLYVLRSHTLGVVFAEANEFDVRDRGPQIMFMESLGLDFCGRGLWIAFTKENFWDLHNHESQWLRL